MKKLSIITIFLLATVSTISAQTTEWNSWNDGYKKAVDSSQTLVVYLYASWCHVCNKMDDNTFDKTEVANKLKTDYVAVKIDVESEEKYNFKNKEYSGKSLLKKLSKGKITLGLPAVLFYYPEKGDLFTEMGYKDKDEFLH